jgi:hypothetical protein
MADRAEFRLRRQWTEEPDHIPFNRRRALAAARRRPDLRKLRRRLLAVGGLEVCMNGMEDPLDVWRMLARGVAADGGPAGFRRMAACRCYQNALALWLKGRGRVVDGWALSEDGLWRAHGWLVTPKGRILETTVRRLAYFGYELTDAEAEALARDNSFL